MIGALAKHLPFSYVTVMFFSLKLVIKIPGLHQQLYQILIG